MSRTIHVNILDSRSIDNAIRELKEYSTFVQAKALELQERVATMIANEARMTFNSSMRGDLINESLMLADVSVTVENDGDYTLVIASGEDAVFMEFGAGVFYNGSVGSSPHPLGAGLGFTIGSYGLGNGAKQVWGFTDENGEFHLTRGTPASMPLYKAVESIRQNIVQIAREVFNS